MLNCELTVVSGLLSVVAAESDGDGAGDNNQCF